MGLEKNGLGMSLGLILTSLISFGVRLCLEMRLMSLGVRLMSLGWVWGKKQLGDEFGVDFDELDEFGGCACCVFAAFGDAVDEFGRAFDEFGRGFGAGAWI